MFVSAAPSPYERFARALNAGDLLTARIHAADLPRISLADALALTLLYAQADPARYDRAAARWLALLVDLPAVTIEEAAAAADALRRRGLAAPAGRRALRALMYDLGQPDAAKRLPLEPS